jgi:hypothetical protein
MVADEAGLRLFADGLTPVNVQPTLMRPALEKMRRPSSARKALARCMQKRLEELKV